MAAAIAPAAATTSCAARGARLSWEAMPRWSAR